MSTLIDNDPMLYRRDQSNRLLSQFLTCLNAPSTLDTSIHRNDEMFAYALTTCHNSWNDGLVEYHRCGAWGWRLVQTLLDQSAATERHWFDFGCGYGRVLRWARAFEPDLSITACEIDPEALRFVGDRFGVAVVASHSKPTGFSAPDETYSLVTAQSVFTHLPEDLFRGWLKRLWQTVAPGGIFCISTNDLGQAPDLPADDGQGFVFERHSESEHLGADAYGTMWVDAGFMRNLLNATLGTEAASIELVPRGIWNAQDLWLIRRHHGHPKQSAAASTPLATTDDPPSLQRSPFGYLEGIELLGSHSVKVEGWCLADRATGMRGDPKLRICLGSVDGGERDSGELVAVEQVPLTPRQDLIRAYGTDFVGGRFSETLSSPQPIDGLETLSLMVDGWPIHFSSLDAADRRIRTARQIEELEVGQRILKAELERKGGIPLRFARAILKRLRRSAINGTRAHSSTD